MRRYNPKELEPKWRKIWEDTKLYKTDMNRSSDKFYVIPMLPYTSGDIHIGHWYNFGPTDTVARFNRMLGQNVLTTIGFDAFGLPAENAAIKNKTQPAKWTRTNIKNMTTQLQKIGPSYDWDHQLATCDPRYYHWNQWLFLKLYEKKLAYRAKAVVNWCPKDQTVLANEQVVGENNVCERCGTPVIQKEMESWYFKITDYTERLLEDLDKVDWPAKVKIMQENWIGKSQGALVDFAVDGDKHKIQVFTTRPDTLYGATYMVLAPEHPLVEKLVTPEQKSKVIQYSNDTKRKTELERKSDEKNKTGVFSGSYAINPASHEKIPIWVADYVLMSYGSGAIMAVPAHDERDYEFAQKFKLSIKAVIKSKDLPYSGEGEVIGSDGYDGMQSSQMRNKIVVDLTKKAVAKEQTNYRLRDWLISRQRYWGTPIPIVHCDECGTVPVPEKDLPVILPQDVQFTPTGRNPLLDREDFVNTKCPRCGKAAKRETDTMDTFVDSSWYFLRYLDNKNAHEIFDREIVNKWAPVDHYIGGIEHAILHLLYARFVTKFLYDTKQVTFDEPFKKLTNQGIILGPDGHKMSKSRGNVVNPDEQVTSYGADSLRLYLMFMGPYDQGGPYNLGGIAGTRRFLDRLWVLVNEFLEVKPQAEPRVEEVKLATITHRAIKKVTKDLEQLAFNTAIATMMALVNDLYRLKAQKGISQSPGWRASIESVIQLLAPFAPHITEEMWQMLGHETSVHISSWPIWNEALITEETMTLAIQINGKVRAEVIVSADIDEDSAVETAKNDPKIKDLIGNKKIQKIVYVPGRLVSFVV